MRVTVLCFTQTVNFRAVLKLWEICRKPSESSLCPLSLLLTSCLRTFVPTEESILVTHYDLCEDSFGFYPCRLSVPGAHPGNHATAGCLSCLLRVLWTGTAFQIFLVSVDLDRLSTCHILCTVSLNLGLSDVFLVTGLGSWVLGGMTRRERARPAPSRPVPSRQDVPST